MSTLEELLKKYHWTENPQLYDDLVKLDQVPYNIVATYHDWKHRHTWVHWHEKDTKETAQATIKEMKADKECVSIVVTRSTNTMVFVRVGPHWESLFNGKSQ